jgi:hypothetical protein
MMIAVVSGIEAIGVGGGIVPWQSMQGAGVASGETGVPVGVTVFVSGEPGGRLTHPAMRIARMIHPDTHTVSTFMIRSPRDPN